MKYIANYLNWHINTAWFESKIFLIEGFSFHRGNGLHHAHYDSPVKFAIFEKPIVFHTVSASCEAEVKLMISRIQFLPVLFVIFSVFIADLPFRGRDFLPGNDSNGQRRSSSAVAFPQTQTLLNCEGARFEVITTEDDLSNNYVTSILQDPDNYHSLRKEIVVSLYEDRAGALWIGTQDGQLNIYDRQSGRFEPDLENLSRGFKTLFILVRCMRILLVHYRTEVMAVD